MDERLAKLEVLTEKILGHSVTNSEKLDEVAADLKEHISDDRDNFAALTLAIVGDSSDDHAGLNSRVRDLESFRGRIRTGVGWGMSLLIAAFGALCAKVFGGDP